MIAINGVVGHTDHSACMADQLHLILEHVSYLLELLALVSLLVGANNIQLHLQNVRAERRC
jgi:hypothetical protein